MSSVNLAKSVFAIGLMLLLFHPLPGLAKATQQISHSTNPTPGDIGWQVGFTINGTDRNVNAIAIHGNQIFIGGNFSVVGNAIANNIALWTGSVWASLGEGVNDQVLALAVDGRGHLYAGGAFTQAGNQPASHIARWDGQQWETLGNGVDGYVNAIVVDGAGNVYVGGTFFKAGDVDAFGIAKWDGVSWSTLSSGISNGVITKGWVNALAIDRYGFLYAGGGFPQSGGVAVNNIARWDGLQWTALGDGIQDTPYYNASVNAIATDSRGNLYVGGRFSTAGGAPALNLARWNGETWSALDGGIGSSNDHYPAIINSLVVDGGTVYVGGDFDLAGGLPVSGIAKWDGASWDDLQGGVWQDIFSSGVLGMAIDRDGKIFSVGDFTLAGGQCASRVAVWDGTGWNGLGASTSVDGIITAIISDRKGGYYASGGFVCAGGQVVNHIAHWDGTTWSGLAGGITGNLKNDPIGAYPRSLALDKNDNLYVGGQFSRAGNASAQNIAKWTGSQWESIGEGRNSDFLGVMDMAFDSQDRLYVVGYFHLAGTNPPQYSTVSRWDGSAWEEIGLGFDVYVRALAFDSQDRVVVGGEFNYAGGVYAPHIARWNGQAWEALGTRNIDPPYVLLIHDDVIYSGGLNIWQIQNGTYQILGGGVSSSPMDKPVVLALSLDQNGKLVIGGHFISAGQVQVNNIARWNGKTWENFGSGLGDGWVMSILADGSDRLIVGGEFSLVGGKVSRNLAIWKDPNTVWLPVVSR